MFMNYSQFEFNTFIKDMLKYIRANFDTENYYFISFRIINYFFFEKSVFLKFKNQELFTILYDLGNEMVVNSKFELNIQAGDTLMRTIDAKRNGK
jgi:hypothetical protein